MARRNGRTLSRWWSLPVVVALVGGPLVGNAIGTHEEPPASDLAFEIVSGPNAGPYAAAELPFTHPIYFRPDHKLNGPTVFGGFGCDAENDIPSRASAGLRPLGTNEDAILVLEEGPIDDPAAPYPSCLFEEKVQNAVDAGYDGVLIARRHEGSEAADGLSCQDGARRDIAGVCITHEALHRIFGEDPGYERPYTRPNDDEPTPGQLGEDVAATATLRAQTTPTTTVTQTQTQTQTVTVTQTQTTTQPTGPDRTAPRFTSAIRVRPRAFLPVPVSAARAGHRFGTTVRFSLSEPASVSWTVQRVERGRIAGRLCLPLARRSHAGGARAAHRRRLCTRYLTRGSFTRRAVRGSNAFPFGGRVATGALPRGLYRLTAVATDDAGNRSRMHRAAFNIARF